MFKLLLAYALLSLSKYLMIFNLGLKFISIIIVFLCLENLCYLTQLQLLAQRIALSWMVQKETDNTHCSGGILADDQVYVLS